LLLLADFSVLLPVHELLILALSPIFGAFWSHFRAETSVTSRGRLQPGFLTVVVEVDEIRASLLVFVSLSAHGVLIWREGVLDYVERSGLQMVLIGGAPDAGTLDRQL